MWEPRPQDVSTHISSPMRSASLWTAEAQNCEKANQSLSVIFVPSGPRAKIKMFLSLEIIDQLLLFCTHLSFFTQTNKQTNKVH